MNDLMNPEMNSDPRYPIGKLSPVVALSTQARAAAIQSIAATPKHLAAAVQGLSEHQLDTPYREGGWTVRQTVHHVADSHIQAFSRIRKALTEDWPAVTPYKENLWSELTDSRTLPVEISLRLLDALHTRWVVLLRSIDVADWSNRGYMHPVNGKQNLDQMTALYAWHGLHHTAHITRLRERMGW